jgi:uncharacterized membrane protein
MEVEFTQMEYNIIMLLIFVFFTILFYFFIETGMQKKINEKLKEEREKEGLPQPKEENMGKQEKTQVVEKIESRGEYEALSDRASSLEKFSELYQRQYISEEEFRKIKKEIF